MRNYYKLIRFFVLAVLLMMYSSVFISAKALENKQKSNVKNNSETIITPKGNPMVIGPDLYDQMGDISTSKYEITEYLAAKFENYNGYLADDFEVPASESWAIRFVKTTLHSQDDLSIFDYFKVTLYADNNGIPGNVIDESEGSVYNIIKPYTNTYINETIIKLNESLAVNAGKYWISINAITSSEETVYDEYSPKYFAEQYLQSHTQSVKKEAHIKNKFYGMSDWTSMSEFNEVQENPVTYPNLNFAIYGEAKANDIALSDVTNPTTDANLGLSLITFEIQNRGTSDVEAGAYSIRYTVDNGDEYNETIDVAIPSGEEIYYEARNEFDFSEVREYTISAEINFSNDEYNGNNNIVKNIINYGKIYPAVENQKTIYTIENCIGTFTDNGMLTANASMSRDTIVFLPEGDNKRIRLEFYKLGTTGSRKYQIFNGSSTDAQLLAEVWRTDIEGMVFEGNNPEGALTFVTPNQPSKDKKYRAKVSCVDNQANDFEVRNITFSKPTSWENETIDIIAHVINKSTSQKDVKVTFTIDDNELGMVSTTIDEFGQSKDVKFRWTPENKGVYRVKATVPADDGQFANENEYSTEHEIFPMGAMVEGFEHQKYPPELWQNKTMGGGFVFETQAELRMYFEGDYVLSVKNDTLITPKLNIKKTDTLKFYYNNDVKAGATELLYAESPNGPWISLMDIPYRYFGKIEQSLDKMPEGDYHLGFYCSGDVQMFDYIRGVNFAFKNTDLVALDFDGNVTPKVGKDSSYIFTIRNMGVDTVKSADYSVKLWKENSEGVTMIDSLPGQELTQANYLTFNFKPTFTVAEACSIFATIELANDEDTANNQSRKISATVIGANYEYILYGEGDSELVDTRSLTPRVRSYSENLYHKDKLNFKGAIKGISFEYKNDDAEEVPLDIYVGETDAEDLNGKFLSTKDMYQVFNGNVKINYTPDEFNTLYIDFDKPYLYTGEKNIVIAFNAVQSYPKLILNLRATKQSNICHHSYDFQNNEVDIDISDPEDINNLRMASSFEEFVPNIIFYTDTTNVNASLTGTVVDTEQKALPEVEISLNNYLNKVKTNTDGKYALPLMPYGDVDVTAVLYSYFDSTQTTTITEGNESVVNFTMQSLPSVGISGTVVANDSLQPIENVEVVLSGYDQQVSTFTDAKGAFIIPNIFANHNYLVTYIHPKYETFVDTVFALLEGTNVGNVILDEIEQAPFNVLAEIDADSIITVSWQAPYSGFDGRLDPTNGTSPYGHWGADINEVVQLGNLFKVDQPGTVTSIELFNLSFWDAYDRVGSEETEASIRIYDKNRNEILSETPFIMPDSIVENLYVDVPDFTYADDFYVMVFINGVSHYSPHLRSHIGVDNVAYVVDAEGKWLLLSEIVGEDHAGAFNIQANILSGSRTARKGLINYNIWRTDIGNVNNSDNWIRLNDKPITASTTANSIKDSSYRDLDNGFYTYIVESYYTLDTAPIVYSNVIDKGIYTNEAIINIKANNGANIDHAEIYFKHSSGHDIYNFTGKLNDGRISFNQIPKGNYTLTVNAGLTYEQYVQNHIFVKDDTVVIDVEIIEVINNPSNLLVTVDQANKNATLNWTSGTKRLLMNDNDAFNYGIAPELGYNVGLGNYFKIVGSGVISSVDVLPLAAINNENGMVRVVIYANDESKLYESDPFVLNDSIWMNINVPNIEYNGSFYAMIEWSATETKYTNHLSFDMSQGAHGGTMRTDEHGFVELSYNGVPVAFGVRASISIGGKQVQINNQASGFENLIDLAETDLKDVVEASEKKSSPKAATHFQIYLDNILVADSVTTKEYVFTETEHLTKEGLATYKAGVKSIYVSGESLIQSVDFEYQRSADTTSINSTISSVGMFPNPANNQITITNSKNANVIIYNALGTIVLNQNTSVSGEVINVSDLSDGVYVVVIDKNNKKIHKNLIIKR